MSAAQQLIPVPFYEDTVVLVGQDEQPYVAMKSVVENMGLAWQAQHAKFSSNRERWGITIIVTPSIGGPQEAMCLPLRKLASWLMTISPNKVKPELRDKIIRYQNECDDALWDYWTKGSATRAGTPNTTQRIAMSRHRLALGKELYRTRDPQLRVMIHQQLDEVSRAMGLPTPALDSIGVCAPAAADALADLWAALAHLDGCGVDYNHAYDERLLAINLPHLASELRNNGYALRFTREMRDAMRYSAKPRFVRHRTEHSQLTGKSIKCWVFEQPPKGPDE
jgi:hypothetical protein